MRRWFSILLLVLMPFQFCWAAAASYCEHETSGRGAHFGHHEHEHQQQHAAESREDSKSKSGATFDGADCHFHCQCMADLPLFTGVPVLTGPGGLTDWTAADALAPLLSRPERPQWTGHA